MRERQGPLYSLSLLLIRMIRLALVNCDSHDSQTRPHQRVKDLSPFGRPFLSVCFPHSLKERESNPLWTICVFRSILLRSVTSNPGAQSVLLLWDIAMSVSFYRSGQFASGTLFHFQNCQHTHCICFLHIIVRNPSTNRALLDSSYRRSPSKFDHCTEPIWIIW